MNSSYWQAVAAAVAALGLLIGSLVSSEHRISALEGDIRTIQATVVRFHELEAAVEILQHRHNPTPVEGPH